ncbi:MAG: cupin domain-containing protein [candidate division Zixibacteria bacterium]|nr:cupin domain-containing protein [candidate division Zixibacteria bacterium]
MNKEFCVRDGFGLPGEYHGHPGGISRVVMGPKARNDQRPTALDTERLVIHTNEYEVSGSAGHPHAHSNQEQAFFILEGRMEVTVGDKTYVAGPGDTVFLPRNVLHGHRNAGDTPLKFLFISAMLDE